MRALHLVYLRGPGGKKLRYYPTEFEPLIIPWWFSGSDREIILAFYQQVLGDEPLQRVEVDWYRSFVPPDRAFLQRLAEKRRSEHLVVVKVRRNDVDLREVLTHPDLQPFRYVAVTCDHSLPNENFGQISELTGFVSQTVKDLYEELASEFSLREDGPELLAPLVQTLLKPIVVVEAYNALIDVQAERVAPDKQRDAVYRRILRRLLEDMARSDAIALCAFALRGREGFNEAIPDEEQPSVLAALRSRMVLRDERLVRWAQWLADPNFVNVVDARVRSIKKTPVGFEKWADKVSKWLKPEEEHFSELDDELRQVAEWLETGQFARARETLETIEPYIRPSTVPTTPQEQVLYRKFTVLVGTLRGESDLNVYR